MNTNYILKKAISQIGDYSQKRIIIGSLSVNIQTINPTLVKRCNFRKKGVYVFIDHNLNFLRYINSPRVFIYKTPEDKARSKKELKLLGQYSKYTLFIHEGDREYEKYEHYKYERRSTEIAKCQSLCERLEKYRENKYKNTAYHQILEYSQYVLHQLSQKILYDFSDQCDWDALLSDFLHMWYKYKQYYMDICNGNEHQISRYLYYKINIIVFYNNLQKEITR